MTEQRKALNRLQNALKIQNFTYQSFIKTFCNCVKYFPTGLAFTMECNNISDTKIIRGLKKIKWGKVFIFEAKNLFAYMYEKPLQ